MTFIISVGRNWTNLIDDLRKQLIGEFKPFRPIRINLLHGKPGYAYNEVFEREHKLGFRSWNYGGSNYK